MEANQTLPDEVCRSTYFRLSNLADFANVNSILDQERLPSYALEAIGRQNDRAAALKSFYHQLKSSLPPPTPRGLDLRTFFPPFANFLDLPSVKLLYLPKALFPPRAHFLMRNPPFF